MTRVLVVDDSPQILTMLRLNLRTRGYEVVEAPTGEQALKRAAERAITRRAPTDDGSQPIPRRHLITEPGLGYRFGP